MANEKIKICRICGNENGNRMHRAREMMFMYGDQFEYIECDKCGCIQIAEIPTNLERYYPKEYYSFKAEKWISTFLKRNRAKYYLCHKTNLIGMMAGKIFGRPDFADWFKRIGVNRCNEILDVGCGIGQRVSYLRDVGFHRVIGIDSYIANDIDYGKNCRVFRCELSDIEDKFDLIMFNHSFEHLENPVLTLETAKQRLKEDGVILIRTPVAAFAWLKYGIHWVQLDAPRHFHVHTVSSMNILTSKVGLKVKHVEFDSTSEQFWGSEQYICNIPLRRSDSKRTNRDAPIFTRRQIEAFEKEARILNMKEQGDQACFYVYRA